LIYSAVPNREAALGDQIASIDPASGNITATWPAPTNPHILAIPDDQSRLYYTYGAVNNAGLSGFSLGSEQIVAVDLSTGMAGASFPSRSPSSDFSYSIVDLAAVPTQSRSLISIDNLYNSAILSDGGNLFVNLGLDSIRVYDDGSPRSTFIGAHAFTCTFLSPGASASRVYCSDGATFSRLQVDSGGISLLDSFALIPGRGSFGHMAFSAGRVYTSTGLIIDPEGKRVINRVNAQGPVAVDGNAVYWLDPSGSNTQAPSLMLRSFDTSTLQPVAVNQINVTTADPTRLIVCGAGCLAFRAGNEVYIVKH